MSRDFTLEKYGTLCRTMIAAQYRVLTVGAYLENPSVDGPAVILRHDVDRKPMNALKMARIEKECSLSSTYYFRKRHHTFDTGIIQQIQCLGHEIGYHYEALVKSGGDFQKAIALFRTELAAFRDIVPVKTICMHGNPFSKWDNRDLWKKFDFRGFGIIGEAYLSIDFERYLYLNDTGRTWDTNKYNIRDKVKVAAHAVRDQENRRLGIGEKTVLIFLTDFTDVRLGDPAEMSGGTKNRGALYSLSHLSTLVLNESNKTLLTPGAIGPEGRVHGPAAPFADFGEGPNLPGLADLAPTPGTITHKTH